MAVIRVVLPTGEILMPSYEATPPMAAELAPQTVNASHLLVGSDFVDAVRMLGCEVSVWTVDDDQVVHLARAGVDSVTTNAPVRVRSTLAAGVVDEDDRSRSIVREIAAQTPALTARARREGASSAATKSAPSGHVTDVDRAIERHVRGALRAALTMRPGSRSTRPARHTAPGR